MSTGKELERPRCKRILVSPEGEGKHIQCERLADINCGGFCRPCAGMLKRNLPGYRRGAAQREAERVAKDTLDQLFRQNNVQIEVRDFDDEFNPLSALLDVAQEQLAWKELCLAKLAKLQEDEWRWDGDRAGEQVRSEIMLYERAIERATNTMIKIARLGIEERLTRVQERQVAIVETAIVRTLQELDLPIDMQARARTRIIKHLKAS